MRGIRLFRRRAVPVPTVTGALILVALICVTGTLAVRALPSFLAVQDPLGRGLLVVEGWMPRDGLQLAAKMFTRGDYDVLVVTGGPLADPTWDCGYETYADRAASELRRIGIVEPLLVVVPSPASAQERTYRSAVSVRQWIESIGRPVSAVDVFSYGPHARRSRELYRMALGSGVAVGSRSAPPSDYELARWWRSSSGAKDVLGEAIGYAWMLCCFRPGLPGSHEESWGEPAR
jgi:hypothetical protein